MPEVPAAAAPRPRKSGRQPEAAIQARILLALQQEWPDALWWVNRTGTAWTKGANQRPISYGLVGSSDILGCLDGKMICVEVKTEDGRQEDSQVKFEAAINRASGIYIIARSPEEAVTAVRAAVSVSAHDVIAALRQSLLG